MNKSSLFCVATFVIGTGTGFLIAQTILKEKYALIAQEEIDSVKEVFDRKVAVKVEGQDLASDILDELNGTLRENLNHKRWGNPPDSLVREVMNTPYHKAVEEYPKLAGMSVSESIVDELDTVEEIDTSKPYLIDEEQYSDEHADYDKITLCYYRDGVLCNENEELVDDIPHTIGHVAFSELARRSPVHVRNEAIACDYEILKINAKYGDLIETPDSEVRRRRTHEDVGRNED